jgi:predicted PurR-regulated permease PerM
MTTKHTSAIDIQKYFILGAVLVLFVSLMIFFSSFFATLLIAIIVVTGVFPLHKLLSKKIRIPQTVSAFISLIVVAVVIITPFILFTFLVANQAAGAYETISVKINALISSHVDFIPSILKKGFLDSLAGKISAYAPISASDIVSTAKDFVGKIGTIILGQTTNILKNLSFFIIQFIVFLFAMFYLLRDGEKLINYVNSLMPLSEEYKKELFKKLSKLSYGIIYGLFGAAIVQGFLVGLAFYIVGVNNAAFWGSVAALLSPIPFIGTSIVWIPVVIALAVGGHWLSAIFLLAWCAALVSTADNIVKPYLIGSSTSLHPLAVLLVLLGGAFAFGLKGLLFGPFVLTLTLAFLHIYKLEYGNELNKKGKEQ